MRSFEQYDEICKYFAAGKQRNVNANEVQKHLLLHDLGIGEYHTDKYPLNKKFLDYLKEIYPSQLTVEKANKSDHLADHLDLTFIIDNGGKLSTRLYDKRDDFDFHIVNFPYLSSNIPSGPSYGVYISQLIRYARCCSHYDDFRYRHKCLVDRLLSQGYIGLRLEKSFKKVYGRYQDLIEKYQRSVNVMVNDSFPG